MTRGNVGFVLSLWLRSATSCIALTPPPPNFEQHLPFPRRLFRLGHDSPFCSRTTGAKRREALGCSDTRSARDNAACPGACEAPCVPTAGRRVSRRSTVAIFGRGPRFLHRHFLRLR